MAEQASVRRGRMYDIVREVRLAEEPCGLGRKVRQGRMWGRLGETG